MPADPKQPGRRRPLRLGRPAAEALEARQLLATIVVDTAENSQEADGSNTLSLYQAIEISDGSLPVSALTTAQAGLVTGPLSTPNTIDFAIPGTGPFVIRPIDLGLPIITKPVVIDGYSQPGSRPNTGGPGQADNAVLLIELDGTQTRLGSAGLNLGAGGSTVEGLAIGGFGIFYTPAEYSTNMPGILIDGAGGDLIAGNFIGTDATGTKAMLNHDGIESFDGSNTIGGVTAAARNVISGNSGAGLNLSGPGDLVEGNSIGTDATGTRPLGNVGGVSLISGDTIGGTAAGAGNLISGNVGDGLFIPPSSGGDLVQGNRIGTDATGTRPLPNTSIGIEDDGNSATIGGTSAGAGNVISGNGGDGIAIDGSNQSDLYDIFFNQFIFSNAPYVMATGNLVEGNSIGTDATGTTPLGNGGDGVSVTGTANTIGGATAGAGNIIADNAGDGVSISVYFAGGYNQDFTGDPFLLYSYFYHDPGGGQSDEVSANSIFGNAGLGIHLLDNYDSFLKSAGAPFAAEFYQDAVEPGDPPGGDDLLAAPTILAASSGASGPVASGTLTGPASTTFTVELFADPAGSGQGRTYLGPTLATTDASGHASFIFASAVASGIGGRYLTATATDPLGDTSEFASPYFVPPSTTTTLDGPSGLSTTGQAVTFTATVSAPSGVIPTGQVAFAEGGVLLALEPIDGSGLATFTTTGLGPGNHVIQAAYLGNAIDSASLANAVTAGVLPTVAHGGPTVISIASPNLNSITITFSRPLRLATAQDIQDYAIIGPDGKAVAIESAVYDPADDSVTLTTRQMLKPHRTYRVTVDGRRVGRVDDVDGIPLSGKQGYRPGTSFAGKVTTPAVLHAKHHPAGPKKSPAVHKARH